MNIVVFFETMGKCFNSAYFWLGLGVGCLICNWIIKTYSYRLSAKEKFDFLNGAAVKLDAVFKLIAQRDFIIASDRLQEFRILLMPYIALTKNIKVQKKADDCYQKVHKAFRDGKSLDATEHLSNLIRLLESS